MENDKLVSDLLRMSEMNSMSLWKRDVCKRAADALSIPAVDAVEVCRCRECKHWYGPDDGYTHSCDVDAWVRPGWWFCPLGQRREEEQNAPD